METPIHDALARPEVRPGDGWKGESPLRGVPKEKRAFWGPPGTPSFEISFQRKDGFLLATAVSGCVLGCVLWIDYDW